MKLPSITYKLNYNNLNDWCCLGELINHKPIKNPSTKHYPDSWDIIPASAWDLTPVPSRGWAFYPFQWVIRLSMRRGRGLQFTFHCSLIVTFRVEIL